MKFGEMKYDVPFEKLTYGRLNFTSWEKHCIRKEGKRLYKLHPEYKYLEQDKDEDVKYLEFFRESVVYAYMTDQILKSRPDLIEKYKIYGLRDGSKYYHWGNYRFIEWYRDFLREETDPGILEHERQEHDARMAKEKKLQELRQSQEKRQLQQDLTAGTRVICPYCKSADTKKISTLSRAASVSLVGAASGKIGKQWHCNHCGSDF